MTSEPSVAVRWAAIDALSEAELDRQSQLLLVPEELERCSRFRFPEDRCRCLLARLLRRQLLSSLVEVAPADWRFDVESHGKPFIVHPSEHSNLHFNLSHSGTLVVCAVSPLGPVGVDVEPFERATNIEELATRVLTASERDHVAELPEAIRRTRFVQYWTLKEAYMKADGRGFSLSPQSIEFDLHSAAFPMVGTPNRDDQWHFYLTDIQQHQIAVAVRCGERPQFALANAAD